MVIGPNGEKMGVKKLEDALTLAKYAGLDLVLMNPGNTPAVGKVMDYNKYQYEQQILFLGYCFEYYVFQQS